MTIGPNLSKLLSISIELPGERRSHPAVLPSGRVGTELAELLERSDGLFAFESSLHIRGARTGSGGLAGWNDPKTWKYAYSGLADELFCFAQDAFGSQFAIQGETVVKFDAETADQEAMGTSLEDWAERVLSDFALFTGQPLAHAWQARYGALSEGQRLSPIIPFVLGGEFSVENLRAVSDVECLRALGSLAVQIRDLPDGALIQYPTRG